MPAPGESSGPPNILKCFGRLVSMGSTGVNQNALLLIKLLHTGIWCFFVGIIGYILHAGLTGRVDAYTWIGIGFVIMEGVVLLLNKGSCPLTPLAARYTENREDNFDIFLPRWLARHNKAAFTTIFVLGVALVVYRGMI
jgi:hypothetical protein